LLKWIVYEKYRLEYKRKQAIESLAAARAKSLQKEIKVLQETREIINSQIEEREKQAKSLQN